DLDKRIPSIKPVVGGLAPGARAQVSVDGAVLPEAALKLGRRVNPGKHEVVATAPGHVPARRLAMAVAGSTVEVELVVRPEGAGAGPGHSPAAAKGDEPPRQPAEVESSRLEPE